jgi:hypothetical protein
LGPAVHHRPKKKNGARTAVIAAIVFGPGQKMHPIFATDSCFQSGPADRAMFVKCDFFHFLFLSPLFDPAGTFVTRIRKVRLGILPLFGVRFKVRPVGKSAAERSDLPDGYRIAQV